MSGLRKMALRITWDGQAKPAVWCPLGDFFGTAPGVNLYKTLLTGMTDQGFYSYWYMPFASSAVIELVNEDTAVGTWISRSPTPRWGGRSRVWAISIRNGTATRSNCQKTVGRIGSCCRRRAAAGSAA